MLCDVTNHFTTARRVTDVNRVLEIERSYQLVNVSGIGIDVIPADRLS